MVCHGCWIRIVIPVIHRIGATVGTLSVSPRGIESPTLYWGTLATVDCWDICIGASKGNAVQWQWIIFGLCPYVVTGVDIISPYHTTHGWPIPCHTKPHHTGLDIISQYQIIPHHTTPCLTTPYHTKQYHTGVAIVSPDGCRSVTVSWPTAVALPISHWCRLERKSRRWRGRSYIPLTRLSQFHII